MSSPALLRRRGRIVLTAAVLALAAACSDSPTGPRPIAVVPDAPSLALAVPGLRSTVCVQGAPGDYGITVSGRENSVEITELIGTLFTGTSFSVANGSCVEFYEGSDPSDGLWVREATLPAGVTLDSIVVQREEADIYPCATYVDYCPVTYTDVDQVFLNLNYFAGYTITFYNSSSAPTEVLGNEGCTTIFWGWPSNLSHWQGYSTSQTVGSVFSEANRYSRGGKSLSQYTLVQGIHFLGGLSISGLSELLIRAGIAGVLNAAHPDVDYARTSASVVKDVNAALASRNASRILRLTLELTADNLRRCRVGY